MIRRVPLTLVLVVALSVACDADRSPGSRRLSGRTMGTTYTVQVASIPAELTLSELRSGVREIVDRVDELMSTYRSTSEVCRFNRYQSREWFPLATETATVLARATRISCATGGAFDVTAGPLVSLWHFGPGPKDRIIPSLETIEAARSTVGFDRLEVRLHPAAARKTHESVQVDVSAIAKGFAVDQIAEWLQQRGIGGFLVEIGGELRTHGEKGDGESWRVGIERPDPGPRRVQRVIEPGNRALATSGDYRNYFEVGEERYSHIIDPRTGRPVAHRLASVSVVADECVVADALATALLVLGPEHGYEHAVAERIPALFVLRAKEGFRERATPRFAQLFVDTLAR